MMTDQDTFFMGEVFKLAEEGKNRHGELPFASIITKDDKVIARDYSTETSERDVTAHAELRSVGRAYKQLGGEMGRTCIYSSGEPCTMCASAILQAKIPRIVVSLMRDDLPNVFRPREIRLQSLAEDSSYLPEIVTGVMAEQMMELFADIKRY
jgi:tRNA(adenine34) deaminase